MTSPPRSQDSCGRDGCDDVRLFLNTGKFVYK
jgi:hypothetical protein